MKLLERDGYRADEYARAGADAAAQFDAVIVPLADLAIAQGRRLGVEVANDTKVEDLAPHFGKLALIAIGFPAFSDGRGFTLARQVRRAGFKGVLRAVGPLIADQFAHALACGFDEIELPDAVAARQPLEQWLRARASISLPYQQGYGRPTNILEQRRRARQASPQDLAAALDAELRDLDIVARLRRLRAAIDGRIVFTTSFGLEDQYISHLIFSNDLDIEVVTLDTGRLFPETSALWKATEEKYGRRIAAFRPDAEALQALIARDGLNGFYDSVDARKACCGVRKVEPLKRALAGAGAWVTGLRGDQSQNRADTAFVSFDAGFGLIKASPLADFSRAQVDAAAREAGVPLNPLHDRGFPSIGCEPCTRAIKPGEDERAGRWWWEQDGKKECGLHVAAAPVAKTDFAHSDGDSPWAV